MIALVTLPNSQVPGDLYAQYMPLKTRQYQNLETAKTYGLDFTLRYRISDEWLVGAAYSWLDTDARVYDTEHDQLQDVVIDGMAHHKGNCFATWSHRFAPSYLFGAGLYGRFSTTRYYQLNGNGKGYHTWRLSTTHDLGRARHTAWRIEAGIDNILDYVDRTPHGLHLGTTTPGRTVYAALTVRFNQGKKLTNNYYKSNLNNKQNDEQD
jgi:outer membrane receptor for ferrienterochelin and colicins